MAFLNKHDVANYEDLKHKIINIWGGQIKIKTLTVKEQQEYVKICNKESDGNEYIHYLIKKSCLDENNKPIFIDGDEDILDSKSGESVSFLVKEILELNKQNPDDVETLAKNS